MIMSERQARYRAEYQAQIHHYTAAWCTWA